MESRMEKYYREDNSSMKRSSKNANLYQEVYHNYDNLDNLPIPDNTNEIDLPELQKMVRTSRESNLVNTREYKNLTKEIQELEETNKIEKKEPENKIHDINKLLEYAKNENNKLKENTNNHENTANYKLLKTLENKIITKEDIENAKYNHDNNTLSKTNELKYQTKKISINPSIDQIITNDSNAELSLDILSDLKPNGDTGVTKPANENISFSAENNELDIINKELDIKPNYEDDEEKEGDFYTENFKFSNKDFEEDDDNFFDEDPKKHYFLKILLLLIFIALCGIAIFYFISNYGLSN